MRIWGFFIVFLFSIRATALATPSNEALMAEWTRGASSHVRVENVGINLCAGRSLPLTVVIDLDSPWTLETVLPFIRKTEEIYFKCGIQLHPLKVVYLRNPALNDFSPSTDTLVTRDYPENDRPVATFTDGLSGYVYANAEYANAFWGKDLSQAHFSKNTVFLDSLGAAFNSGSKKSIENYEAALAHELLHTLLNVGHNTIEGNLLNENMEKRGFEISTDQCNALLKHPLVL
jgi:hypothetical protein